jgi:hypothetical protein
MFVRVPLLGSGVELDAYRVDLPNYRMIANDPVGMTALVEVPDADLPPEIAQIRPQDITNLNGRNVLTNMPALVLLAWRRHLRNRYANMAVTFQPSAV